MDKLIYLGADHGGYELKEKVKNWLDHKKIKYQDLGTDSKESVDYPIYAKRVAKAVAQIDSKGILICRSGQGMAIAANKMPGVRACIAWDPWVATKSREHNDSNVLCLPADYISDKSLVAILQAWLFCSFSGHERHKKRLAMLDKISTDTE